MVCLSTRDHKPLAGLKTARPLLISIFCSSIAQESILISVKPVPPPRPPQVVYHLPSCDGTQGQDPPSSCPLPAHSHPFLPGGCPRRVLHRRRRREDRPCHRRHARSPEVPGRGCHPEASGGGPHGGGPIRGGGAARTKRLSFTVVCFFPSFRAACKTDTRHFCSYLALAAAPPPRIVPHGDGSMCFVLCPLTLKGRGRDLSTLVRFLQWFQNCKPQHLGRTDNFIPSVHVQKGRALIGEG